MTRREVPRDLAFGLDGLGPALAVLPFAAIAIIGQLVAIWDPNPIRGEYLLASCGLMALTLGCLLVKRFRVAAHGPVLILVLYVASVATLELAEGGSPTGSGVLLLVPLVASALFFGYVETFGVTLAVLATILWISLADDAPPDLTIRKLILWLAICVVVAVPIHALRTHLRASVAEAQRLLHQSRTLEAAARELTTLRTESEIIEAATRLATLVVSSPDAEPPRTTYRPAADPPDTTDGTDAALFDSLGTADAAVLLVGAGDEVVDAPTDPIRAVFVRVAPDRTAHGFLVVVSDTATITLENVNGLTALGQLVELSLSNLIAHHRLEDQVMADERRRIARELHDGLAHELAFIAARVRSSELTSLDVADLTQLAQSADRALDEARRAITVLSSSDHQRLRDSIAQTAEDLSVRHGIPIDLELTDDVEVSPTLCEHLLRIVREAITNAARHGHPTQLTIYLWYDKGHHLVVEDNGNGFELDGAARGFGLTSMRERAEAIGGELLLRSAPNEGTRVEVHIP